MTKNEFVRLAKENGHTNEEIQDSIEFVAEFIREIKRDGEKTDWTIDNFPYDIFLADFLFMNYES